MKKIQNLKIKLKDNMYDVYVIRKKIKNTYIRIDDNLMIKVTTNHYTPLVQIKQLIFKNQDKIINHIQVKKRKSLAINQIAYLGKIVSIEFKINNQYKYKIQEDKIIFYLPDLTKKDLMLDRFYQEEANKIIPSLFETCLKNFTKQYNLKAIEYQMRKMKVRYGTCYYKKNKIFLNTYLVKYEKIAINYVIYHELCHFIVNNHSKKFYQVLENFVFDHNSIRQLLNKY